MDLDADAADFNTMPKTKASNDAQTVNKYRIAKTKLRYKQIDMHVKFDTYRMARLHDFRCQIWILQ